VSVASLADDNRELRFGVNPSKLHICISYCRHTKAKPELAAALTWQLREVYGYDVWLDKDGSSLCTRTPNTASDKQDNDPLTLSDHMQDVIAKSHTVIVCLSREYKNKQSCNKVRANVQLTYCSKLTIASTLPLNNTLITSHFRLQSMRSNVVTQAPVVLFVCTMC
jgi:hypothetical protein